jgi:(1->4)-alpha-D-glucan 1-alpha-D-glucosylmutase
MSVPRATMRLQFHRGFTFDAAARIVPYLAALHVSHLYASPILTARAGSRHGYDVVDPTRVNPELGGEPAFRRLVAALRAAGLGIIVDIVPNHMAIGGENPWWLDVLRLGRRSRYARHFDIDWEPEDEALRGKVLAPVLGRPYGEALAQGEIRLAFNADADRFEARYFEHVFPLDPDHRADIERDTLAFDPATPQGRTRLHELLERQNFRLAWWRTANDEINWRRFFDINELAALRVEDDEVFEAAHAKLFALFGDGLIDGVRIDHVDGLADPGGYCRKLRQRLAGLARPPGIGEHPYIVVEKILGAGEELSAEWDCDGTSGYDFMDQVSAVLHDPAGEQPLGRRGMDRDPRAA